MGSSMNGPNGVAPTRCVIVTEMFMMQAAVTIENEIASGAIIFC